MTMANVNLSKEQVQEAFCEATNILIKKQLESLSFDTTIEATVIDASRALEGTYTVSTGSSSFLAYTTETGYKKDDVVMVTIPQGDYNKQKTIIGKQVDNLNTPMIYKSPFQELINVSNNLISGEHEYSLWANAGERYGWDTNVKDFQDSDAYNLLEDNKKLALLWDSANQYTENGLENSFFESRFTRLGIKAQFSTWLKEYDTAYGNYGLAVLLIFSNSDFSGTFGKFVVFDSNDFFGDVYNFETYYTQEAIFDISEYIDYPIRRIQLYAYQRNNFKNVNNDFIYEAQDIDGNGFTTIQPNIFIKDPYICLGMPTSEFNADAATIITESDSFYKKNLNSEEKTDDRLQRNTKILGLRWVHKDAKTDTIASVLPNELPENYHIYWYRYTLGAPSPDTFAGAHWERFYGCKPIPDNQEEYCLTKKEIENGAQDLVTDQIDNIEFYPNVNRQSEQLKAIIVKRETSLGFSDNNDSIERMIAVTPIIEFTNNDDVRSKATVIDENALSIKFEDEARGNYFIYDKAGNISKEQDGEIRFLTAVFDLEQNSVYEKPELTQPYTSIKWSFPASSSMIIPSIKSDINGVPLSDQNKNSVLSTEIEKNKDIIYYNSVDDTYDFIFEREEDKNDDHWKDRESNWRSVGYFINKTLNHNANRNIVRLEINKDGQLYTAQVQMLFGNAGTSGSDYTLAIIWDNNDNAFDINKGVLSGQACLFDQTGSLVDINNSDAKYEFEWYKIKSSKVPNFENKNEDRDLYYPVVSNNSTGLGILREYDPVKYGNTSYHYLNHYIFNDTNKDRTNIQYYQYNLNTKEFEPTSWSLNKILYRKKQENETMKIIGFRPFDEVRTTSLHHPTNGEEAHGGVIIQEDNKRIFYYGTMNGNDGSIGSKHIRAFIKYNDTYIIDPWDEYSETETYYEPILSSKKDYNASGDILRIVSSEIENGRFDITDTGVPGDPEYDSQMNTRTRKPNIETDLYILQVTLKNFGDYNLIARFPIPLKNSDPEHNGEGESKTFVVDFIEGPTNVRYSTSGETDFNKNPYQITLRLLTNNNDNNDILTYTKVRQGYIEDPWEQIGHWELIYDNSAQANITFLPKLIESGETSMTDVIQVLINPLQELLQNNQQKSCELLALINLARLDMDATITYLNVASLNAQYLSNVLRHITKLSSISYNKVIKASYSSLVQSLSESERKVVNYINQIKANQINYQTEINNLITQLKKLQVNEIRPLQDQIAKLQILNNTELYFVKPLLLPSNIYFEDIPLYGVRFVLDKNIVEYEPGEVSFTIEEINENNFSHRYIKKGTTLWTQPIYVYQDNYPSTTLNKWNGKDIVTDEETGIISASGFSAGKKENDNTFTGVVIGDWSKTDSDIMMTKQTGIYGFNHGKMSYALKDDGTAFFGKDGKGRIYFNGNTAQIYSAQWVALLKDSNNNPVLNSTGNYKQQRYGLMIDVDNGILDSRGKGFRKTYLAPGVFKVTGQNPDPLFQQSDEQTILEVSDSTYILRSANYYKGQINNPPKGSLDGRGLEINLNNGRIQGYDFTLTAGADEAKIIINTEDDTYPFKIGKNFSVQWNGSIKSSLGIIGGWHISEGRLSSSSDSTNNNAVYLAAGSGIGNSNNPNIHGAYIKGGTIEGSTIKVGIPSNNQYPFEVNSSGALRATSGTIGNWIIDDGLLRSEDRKVSLSPTGGINLNNLFRVTTDGYLTATSGTIGGWTINSGTLTGGGVTLNSNGTISGGAISGSAISGGSISIGSGNTSFDVTGGKLTAKNAEISGNFDAGILHITSTQNNLTVRIQTSPTQYSYFNGYYPVYAKTDTIGYVFGIKNDGMTYINQLKGGSGSFATTLSCGSNFQSGGTITGTGIYGTALEVTNSIKGNGLDIYNIDCANIVVHGYIYDINSTNGTQMRLIPKYGSGNTVTWECQYVDDNDIPKVI